MPDQTIKVLVNGSKGKMGSETVLAVQNAKGMELVGQIDIEDHLERCISELKPDVVVDFTEPDCALKNALAIANTPSGGVIGTTGFSPEEIEKLHRMCEDKTPGILIAPNFAIGAVIMMKLSQIAAQHMPDVEIIELHHPAKKDAPSGTAIKTAEMISQNQGPGNVPRGTHHNTPLGQPHYGIPIHSVRLPGLLAHQEVIFGDHGQTLRICHDTINRTCFMPGVILGIRKVMDHGGLTYGLEEFLFDS